MSLIVESIPETGRLELEIKVSADVNVSAFAARQKVNSFVLSEISYMLHAGQPVLAVGERIRWQVPVVLSLTSIGDIGQVGIINVDVETGQMNITPQIIAEISSRAETVAQRSPSETTK